ncbi:tautomerase family protein [Microbacterium invictum]|uniref:Phenylpyruvate tautomerase PptA (4-oxalocrotonate tautomerase family) n=1 Tax=Microbacterium invictum TaxID=515415 RepID=A0AA40SR19_9MICO|nr:tautomerase family protein [Microbacterium invictum]MBB4140682.1 phenylpyruvate tautomerase PptA (4-oxalocrotonate tautomerase family) [Microbacterium invictum]
MPAVLIEVRRRYTQAEEAEIMAAVHRALVAAFRIPQEDRNVRLIVHEPHRFSCSADLSHPEYRTIVTIDCFAGRSADAKRRLYAGIADELEGLGIPRDHVSTIVHEIQLENWGVGGGHAASDVDLGFTVDV